MGKYVTRDMIYAAWIDAATGKGPDALFTTDESYRNKKIIYMVWENIPDEDIEKLSKGGLSISRPDDFSSSYNKIKRMIFEKLEEENNGQNDRATKAAICK